MRTYPYEDIATAQGKIKVHTYVEIEPVQGEIGQVHAYLRASMADIAKREYTQDAYIYVEYEDGILVINEDADVLRCPVCGEMPEVQRDFQESHTTEMYSLFHYDSAHHEECKDLLTDFYPTLSEAVRAWNMLIENNPALEKEDALKALEKHRQDVIDTLNRLNQRIAELTQEE